MSGADFKESSSTDDVNGYWYSPVVTDLVLLLSHWSLSLNTGRHWFQQKNITSCALWQELCNNFKAVAPKYFDPTSHFMCHLLCGLHWDVREDKSGPAHMSENAPRKGNASAEVCSNSIPLNLHPKYPNHLGLHTPCPPWLRSKNNSRL